MVGVISGGVTGTYVRIAADLANALDDSYELRVLPVIGCIPAPSRSPPIVGIR